MPEVPKILWQSYKSIDRLPVESLPCIDSWLRLNPGWSYYFCSDEDIEAFFRHYHGGSFLSLFEAMPLAVMKADLWRYAVLEEFGGFYADIDTICYFSLEDWLDRQTGLHVACEEEDTYFSQWAFGGPPHHCVFRTVLELIRERVERDGGVDQTMDHYVHHYTGPSVWSDAIRKHLGVEKAPGALADDRALQRRREVRIYPPDHFNGTKIRHITASMFWRRLPGYESWQAQRRDLANRLF
ncbi:hypothetical protein JIN85_17830 [Luteolibacter pohnpeiensis]|uniref:Glycosyl transferase n=1 Tax=Luteolibacter pohnpeiensis TaxID=454153 RepID=A0A934VY81_9BACT|nr:glycosyltransferase [Luteolibacter pohnpeiensis]MBK1884284.1 hypothetical protein [Luteolibacter pohnpeiensis]